LVCWAKKNLATLVWHLASFFNSVEKDVLPL
jgi:hypothetical protein